MSVTSNFRKHLKAIPEIAKFVMPSTKYEVLLDHQHRERHIQVP